MFGPWKASLMMLGALTGLLLAGCGTNPYGQVDQYGNPIDTYNSGGYGSTGGYDSGYGGYDSGSSYGSDYGSDYGSGSDYSSGGSYGSDYGSGSTGYDSAGGYGSDYGSTGGYGSDYGSGTGYGTPTTGGSPAPSARPSTPVQEADDTPVLTAWVTEVKETGVLGMGKVIAKVEVENPSNRTLSGRLRVLFTDNGKPTANAVGQRLTLAPFEKRQLTFTANAWRLDDAEATIETDAPKKGDSSVSDRN